MRAVLIGITIQAILVACTTSKSGDAKTDSLASAQPDTARLIASPGGLSQPEAVRYDPEQDIYFVSNFGPGDAQAKDNNGFISRMTPHGIETEAIALGDSCAGSGTETKVDTCTP